MRACFACDTAEVSLSCWLFLVRSAGGVEPLMNVAGGYQDSQFEGGVGRVTDAMAAELGDAVVLWSPVTAVTQRADRVEIVSEGATVSSRCAVLALPRALAAAIRFEPALPADHALAPAPDARRNRSEDGGDLRHALLARRRHQRSDRGHRRHHRDHPRHHAARPRPRGHRHLRRRAAGPGAVGHGRTRASVRIAHHARPAPRAAAPPRRSRCWRSTGPRSAGPAGAPWRTSRPGC